MLPPALPQSSPWLGQVLKDTYRIDKLVGEGGTGLVFLGCHLRLKVAVAVKVLKQNAGALADARFRKEAEITARLRHPNIVQVLDYDISSDGHAFLVTEWLEGETLLSYLKRSGPLPAEAAVALLRPICEAVAAAHAAGVVHRDLKPANLFLSQPTGGSGEPLVKVLDFGIAKLTDVDPVRTEQGQTVGTPRYMSPEQIRVESGGEVGPQSDQFSLGCIAYELVMGKAAFPGSAHVAMLAVLGGRTTPLPDTVPAAYRGAVARALSLQPSERYPGVMSFWRALAGIDATTAKVTVSPPEPSPSALPRVALAAAAAVGGLAAALALLLSGRGPAVKAPRQPPPATLRAVASDNRGSPGSLAIPAAGAGNLAAVRPEESPTVGGGAKFAPAPAAGGDEAAAPAPKVEWVWLRVKMAPEGATLFVDQRPVRGGALEVPIGQPLRLRVQAPAEKQRCCPAKELRLTPSARDRGGINKVITLDCDRDCPIF